MRAFLNLVFFALILCCGLAAGYLFARTGNTVPGVTEKLDALVPASLNNGPTAEELTISLNEQTAITQQLNTALQTARAEAAQLGEQNQRLVVALNQPAPASTSTAASEALVTDLIEQNQFLTDELTTILGEKTQVEAQLAAAQNNTQNNSGTSATASADLGAAQQQITQLTAERQQLVQSLTTALGARDALEADKRNLQVQLQNVLAQVQSGGGNVQQLLQNSGIDLNALSQGQGGTVIQGIVNGLGN